MPANALSSTPVIVGVAQVVQRPGDGSLEDARGPIELVVDASRRAAADAGGPGLLQRVGFVGVAGGWFRRGGAAVSDEQLVLVERSERVGVITMNRPDARNAINSAITLAIADAIDELEADDNVWVLVITGAGDRSFCAGADLKEVAAGRPRADANEPVRDLGGFAGITGRRFVKPVIAAVNGTALGGGTEICLACDLVVAEEHATFGLPEVRRGLFAGAMGLERLPRRVPPAIAMELILTGQPISATRALELGLINRVVPQGSCVDAAVQLARVICEGAPLAVRYSKAVARASFSMGEDMVAGDRRDLRRALFASDDFREGPRAFAEKRPPEWKGR